jgi:phosphatidylinositol alpha-mannosyltransferase
VLPIQFLRYSEAVNVGTFHAAREGGQPLYAYGRRLLQRWFRRLDGKIAVSTVAARLISAYFPGYYNLIPNGVDCEFFDRASPLPEYADGRPNILYLGRLEKRKGLPHLLKAYRRVKEEMPEARLIVVGEGGLRAACERYVRSTRLADVVFTGRVSDEEKARYFKTAHVYCAPNMGAESQGIVLLEAMSAGRPVVASNIEGFATVVTHGVEGLLVLPEDIEGLAAAIVQLLRDPNLRCEMGERGRQRAQQYSWERISQRVLSYYERLIHEKRQAPFGEDEIAAPGRGGGRP